MIALVCTTIDSGGEDVASLLAALAARCGNTVTADWPGMTPVHTARSTAQDSIDANAARVFASASSLPTAEQSNSTATVNAVDARVVESTRFVNAAGGGAAACPEPVIAMHSS